MLKSLVSDHPLLFYHAVAKRAHSRKRPALVTTTFSNSRGGRLRERRLYEFEVVDRWFKDFSKSQKRATCALADA